MYSRFLLLLRVNSQNQQRASHGIPLITCLIPSDDLCSIFLLKTDSKNLQINFIPSQSIRLLTRTNPRRTPPSGHSGFILHAVTRLHRPEFQHYYGIICHLSLHQKVLGSLLVPSFSNFEDSKRLPRLRRTPCEQSHPQSRI